MGGGDLNLKKSWHPSTMRNMEKVWKAEQKYDQEKKRIAELQREIREEKAREDIQKYAQEKGVLEKKDSMKLDWMYKGPGGVVDREEYLLGRAIDKSFEQMQHAEKASTSTSSRSTVELDCLPSSIFSGGDEQVDMARKLQEDPLYIIKKKEIESRSQILKNPVKLKQLQELIKEEKSKKSKKHKKGKKKKNEKKKSRLESDSDSFEDDGKDLDALLAAKYIKLKKKLHKTSMAKLRKSQSDSSDGESKNKYRNSCMKETDTSHIKRRRYESDQEGKVDHRMSRRYGLQKMPGSKDHSSRKKYQPMIQSEHSRDESHPQPSSGNRFVPKKVWVKPERKRFTEGELEQRRLEMMDNAKWREKERERNVAKYKAQEEREKNQNKDYNGDFLRKQLSYAASQGSVESRIKANVNNIQRSGREMDRNFARR